MLMKVGVQRDRFLGGSRIQGKEDVTRETVLRDVLNT